MENLLANIGLIKNMGIMGSGIKSDRKFAMIATKDVATVAADHLCHRDFSGKHVHELVGERDVSLNEATKIIGEKIEKPDLHYVQFSTDDEKKGMMDAGLSEDASHQLIELNQAINDGILAVNIPRTASNTTHTSIEEFANFFLEVYENS